MGLGEGGLPSNSVKPSISSYGNTDVRAKGGK